MSSDVHENERIRTRSYDGICLFVWHGEDMASFRSHNSWLAVSEALAQAASSGDSVLDVIDVGGGSGADAVRVAQSGHRVTVVDTSTDALATLHQRAREAKVEIASVQSDGELITRDMFGTAFDVALCHGVVEYAQDPVRLVSSISRVLRPGGVVSIVVPGLVASIRHAVSLGDVDEAQRLLDADPNAWDLVALGPRRYVWSHLEQLMVDSGFGLIGIRGVRAVSDGAPPEIREDNLPGFAHLLELEKELRSRPEFAAGSGGLQALGRLD